MSEDTRPVVVAFDGSPQSRAAVEAAATLFRGRTLLIASVWEPGLAMLGMTAPDPTGLAPPMPSPEEVAVVDRHEQEHAGAVAEAGARLARDLGAQAEAAPAPEGVNIAETVLALAEDRDAAAVVVGSRGLGAVKSRLLGSTSRKLLHDTHRPVLVVRA